MRRSTELPKSSDLEPKNGANPAFLVIATILPCGLAVLLHYNCFAVDLRLCDVAGSGSTFCVSLVCACIDPGVGGDGSFTPGKHPLLPSSLCFDTVEDW